MLRLVPPLTGICFFAFVNGSAPGQTYPFRHYSTADGLSHAVVRKVFQDSQGFLWVGTGAGLMRYDGHEFRDILPRDRTRSAVHEIFEGDSGTIWIGTYGAGLAKLSAPGETLSWLTQENGALPGNYVTAIHRDDVGIVWVGTNGGILALFPHRPPRVFRAEFGSDHGEIYGIASDRNGSLWVATHSGLFRGTLDASGNLSAVRFLTKPTRSVLVTKNGDVLAGTSGGGNDRYGFVCRLRAGSVDTIISYSKTGTLIKGQSLCEDEDGNTWIGTGYGVFVSTPDRLVHLGTANDLPNDNIYDIMQDREGTLWFGTENGLAKLTTPRFLTFGMAEGLTSYEVISLVADRDQNLWVGMWNGLNRLAPDGTVSRWDDTHGLQHHSILSIAQDAGGTIYAGQVQGVDRIRNGRVLTAPVRGLRPEFRAQSMVPGKDGSIWIGAIGEIVRVKNGAVVARLSPAEGIPEDYIGPLFEDQDGVLWFGTTRYGVGRLTADSVQLLSTDRGLPDPAVHFVGAVADGAVWICTEGGIAAWSRGTVSRLRFNEPDLDEGPVHMAVVDSMGHVWLGTDHGVYEWTGSTTRHFTSRDGLASDIVPHGLVTPDGEVWFGTEAGVSRFERSRRPSPPIPPPVRLSHVTAGDDDRVVQELSVLDYGDRSLTFRFNALSYIDEESVRYQWMVNGFDREWQKPERQRQVRYTNLPPGSYVFTVRAANRNSGWSKPARLTFSVRPPYWRTWWFLSLCVLAVGSAAAIAYRYRVGQILKMERMRTQIAADLHDDIASSLASMAIYSDVIGKQLPGTTGETAELLGRIRDLSREVTENIGLIVWAVDPRKDELSEVVHYFQRHARQLCTAAGVEFQSEGLDSPRPQTLSPDRRRTIFLILKEALNNTLRHSGCSRVQLSSRLRDGVLSLTLSDNGRGFDQAKIPGGHGLTNMQRRARAIQADLTIASSPDRGTTLTLALRMA